VAVRTPLARLAVHLDGVAHGGLVTPVALGVDGSAAHVLRGGLVESYAGFVGFHLFLDSEVEKVF